MFYDSIVTVPCNDYTEITDCNVTCSRVLLLGDVLGTLTASTRRHARIVGMVVRFVCVIRVPVSCVSRLPPGVRCLFTGKRCF